MNFNEAHFWEFCSHLVIPTKEFGEIRLETPMGSQRYFIRKLAEALRDGRHTIVCLKGRQLGISTIMLALDLYWAFNNPGIEQLVLVHEEMLRDKFRSNILMYYESLPPAWRERMVTNNRNATTFKNKSSCFYKIVGPRSADKLGRGAGLTFLHASEIASWSISDEELTSMKASMAETNPNRLFVYESTAKGIVNVFHDLWESAEASVTQAAIFVPWWSHEGYSIDPASSPEAARVFATYWGRPEGEPVWRGMAANEIELWRRAERLYGHTPTPGQIAWMRVTLHDKCSDDENRFLEEYPITEVDAFRVSGSQFFSNKSIGSMVVAAKKSKPDYYRMTYGRDFDQTEVREAKKEYADLRVWQPPVKDASAKGNAFYVIGADPAYGSSEWADRFAAQVYRVYADGMDLVAEYCTENCTTAHFAWAIVYLAGWYDNTWINLELNGPGQVVLQELEALRQMPGTALPDQRKSYAELMRHVFQYRYLKFNGSSAVKSCRHWTSTPESKWRMLSTLRDSMVRGLIDIHSAETLTEMMGVVLEDGVVGASGRDKDDRVIATGLAHICWIDNLKSRLMRLGHTRASVSAREAGQESPITNSQITRMLSARGIGAPKVSRGTRH